MSHKRIHCCKSRFSSRGKCSWNNTPSSTLVHRSNNVVLWTHFPLFTSPFFRVSCCLYPFWNSSRSKNCVSVFKNHMVLKYTVLHTEWDHTPPKKIDKKGGAELGDRLFGQNKLFFCVFFFFFIYVYVCFVGNVAESVWLASVCLIVFFSGQINHLYDV